MCRSGGDSSGHPTTKLYSVHSPDMATKPGWNIPSLLNHRTVSSGLDFYGLKVLCTRLGNGSHFVFPSSAPADNAAMVIGWLPIVGPIESGVGFRSLWFLGVDVMILLFSRVCMSLFRREF
jgi:hypothetical protein